MSEDRTQKGGDASPATVEQRDVPAGIVALLLAALVATLLLVCAAVAGMMMLFDRSAPPQAPPPPAALTPPEPRLQLHEPAQRHRLEADAQPTRRLDEAMARVAAQGWEGGR